MKYVLSLTCLILISVYSCKTKSATTTNIFTKGDLEKLRWIEGNWKGMDGTAPFYEIYKIINDSTLEITSYEWNGSDSSKTSKAYIAWRQNHYFLGDSLNWRASVITRNSVFLIPNYKATNSILWQKKNQNNWEAVLTSSKGVKNYPMERVAHFTAVDKKVN